MRLCCLGGGPLVQVASSTLDEKVTPLDATSIINALDGGATTAPVGDLTQPFFTQQMSVVLENSGNIRSRTD